MRSKILPLSSLSNEEFIQFFTLLLGAIQTDPQPLPTALYSAKAHAELILSDIKWLYRRDHVSPLTQRLVALDNRRDELVQGLQEVLAGHCYNPEEALRDVAAELGRHLEVYGPRIDKHNYEEETEIIGRIVRAFREDPTCAAGISSLGLGYWVDALDRVNTEFDRVYRHRDAFHVDTDVPYTMIEKRDELRVAYENLLNKLDGFYHTAEGAEPWATMVLTVDILTEEYREIVAERKGRSVATHAFAEA